jgi:uncharacterized protein YjiS (DUF1127 family)
MSDEQLKDVRLSRYDVDHVVAGWQRRPAYSIP